MALFSKLIKCSRCGSNYNARKDKGRRVYICSQYHNYKNCKRVPIDENTLRHAIEHRFKREMTDEEIREVVEVIYVREKMLFEIHFKDEIPIIYSEKFIQY